MQEHILIRVMLTHFLASRSGKTPQTTSSSETQSYAEKLRTKPRMNIGRKTTSTQTEAADRMGEIFPPPSENLSYAPSLHSSLDATILPANNN